MTQTLRRALRLTASPGEEWQLIKAEEPLAAAIVFRFLLPLALIPAVSLSLGLLLSGIDAGGRHATLDLVQIVRGGLIVYVGVVLSVCLSAASIMILAPLFAAPRDWPRALRVAAYSASPVLLCGLLLLVLNLSYVLILPFFHGLYLQYAGLQHVLAVKERDAAEYVALSSMLLMALSTALGAFAGWLGIL